MSRDNTLSVGATRSSPVETVGRVAYKTLAYVSTGGTLSEMTEAAQALDQIEYLLLRLGRRRLNRVEI